MGIFEGLNLEDIEHTDLVALRQVREQDISHAIHDINLIHVEMNRRVGKVALPEFGSPMTSTPPLNPEADPDDAA